MEPSISSPKPAVPPLKRTLDEASAYSQQKRFSHAPDPLKSVPHFLIVHSTDESRKLSMLSPFFLNKALQAMAGAPKSVKKLRSGDLLVETSCDKHSELLLRTTALGDVPVSVAAHQYLNSSRGVIANHDLLGCSDEEMIDGLKDQGVIAARRIMFRRDGVLVPSRNIILTFDRPTLPTSIKAGYLHCEVRPYIPNPVRCFKCQVFGHSSQSCRGKVTCGRCGQPDHDTNSCNLTPACVNCRGDHPSFSRSCPKWAEEKAIQRVKTIEQLSYPEARRKVVPPATGKPTFAAVVKATTTRSVQTDISVPPTESFAVQARFLLAPSKVSAGTQSPISALGVTQRSHTPAPSLPASVTAPYIRQSSKSGAKTSRSSKKSPGASRKQRKKQSGSGCADSSIPVSPTSPADSDGDTICIDVDVDERL